MSFFLVFTLKGFVDKWSCCSNEKFAAYYNENQPFCLEEFTPTTPLPTTTTQAPCPCEDLAPTKKCEKYKKKNKCNKIQFWAQCQKTCEKC